MQKILLFLGLLLIDEMFHDNTIVQAIMPYPYFRHQRYPIRENSQQPLLVVHAVPITDMVCSFSYFHQFLIIYIIHKLNNN